MSRFNRLAFALLLGGAALSAQIPNPLNLPDPLGLSKKPAPAPAPTPRREARRAPRRSPEEGKRHEGKHKGHDRGKHKGHRD
ncbi:MAG TPA: hypothetical protein VJ505_01915 [Holophagaceae bacterium]|nr:hypothetical protein [Holophagaceae bacterium]